MGKWIAIGIFALAMMFSLFIVAIAWGLATTPGDGCTPTEQIGSPDPNDPSTSEGDACAPAGDETEGGTVSGNVQQLSQQILKLIEQGKVTQLYKSPTGDTIEQLERAADGKPMQMTCVEHGGPKNVDVQPGILKFIVDAGNQGIRIDISNITDKCHSSTSNHYQGKAVDLGCSTEMNSKLEAIIKKYGGKNNGEVCPANGHWHYDFL